MTSVIYADWRQSLAMGGHFTLGTCLQNGGASRNVGREAVASKLGAHHLIAKAAKKLP
jgi:hypothetical protein